MRARLTLQLVLPTLLSILAASGVRHAIGADSIYDIVHQRPDLPTGGAFAQHPDEKNVHYYYTNRLLMWPDKSNVQKHSGLYRSTDSGTTWKLVCYILEFHKLFIHPETNVLYAIIGYDWLKNDEEGYLVRCSATKIVMSEDGKHWKDITGGNGYVADLVDIFQDPDHPRRVCLAASVMRGYVLQATDDAYSKWTWYKEWDWEKRPKKN
jgi:hypothetical protein